MRVVVCIVRALRERRAVYREVMGEVGVECGCCCRRVLAVGLETCTPDWKSWRWNGPACRLPFPIALEYKMYVGPGMDAAGRLDGPGSMSWCAATRSGRWGMWSLVLRAAGEGESLAVDNNNNSGRCWRRLACCRGELQLGGDWLASRWDDGPGARFLGLIWVIRVIWGRSNARLPEKHSKPARGQQPEPGPEPARNATRQGKARRNSVGRHHKQAEKEGKSRPGNAVRAGK